MNAETVSYRYAPGELSALLLVLNLDALPGAPLAPLSEADYRAAMDSLAEAGIVTPAGDRAIIDRLTALLLSSAARSRCHIRFDAGGRTVVLWFCRRLMGVLGVFPARGECALTPLRSEEEARDALTDALARCAYPVSVASPALAGGEAVSAEDAAQLTGLYERLSAMARAPESPDQQAVPTPRGEDHSVHTI